MSNFQKALKEALGIEGGYSDNKDDNGGKTNFGITKRLAVAYGYKGLMKDLSKETAIDIYKKEFWDNPKLNLIENYSLLV